MNNRIGIEIQTELPTLTEMRKQLNDKWKKVKDGFTGKINVDVDGNSLRSLTSRIQKTLNEKTFEIKIDSKDALTGIHKMNLGLNELDKKIAKTRNIQIGIKVEDLDKNVKDMLNSIDKAYQDKAEKSKLALEMEQKKVKELSDEYKKLSKEKEGHTKYEQNARQGRDGTVLKSHKYTNYEGSGVTKSVTLGDSGEFLSAKYTEDKKKALGEIEAVNKRIYQLQSKELTADKETVAEIQKELKYQKEQKNLLEDSYYQKYKMYSFSDKGLAEKKRQNEVNLLLKASTELYKEQVKEQKVLNSAIATYVKYEKDIQSLQNKLVNAGKDEARTINNQIVYLTSKQGKLNSNYKILENMNSAQKEELQHYRNVASLERAKLQAKKEDVNATRTLSSIHGEIINDLKTIHRYEKEIVALSEKKNKSQVDYDRLEVLKKEVAELRNQHSTNMQIQAQEGNITASLEEQLKKMKDIHSQEIKRISTSARIKNNQDDVNSAMQSYRTSSKEIAKLQRDLIYAGMREKNIIEDKIRELEKQRRIIKQSIDNQNQMTDAIKKEINAIERAEKAQRELNQARQDSREKDQSFNDTGGLIDPYSYVNAVERVSTTVLESVARLDEAMIGVTKVADATQTQFDTFAQTSYDVASSLGVSADAYMNAVTKWITAGKTFSESQELAQTTLVGAFVGNIDEESMVKYLSVPMNAYEEMGLTANDVVNSMNEVSNNYAIEMNDLGEAFVRSAVTAKDAGISYEYLTAMITGAQEATRKGGERIGTGIKTISMNMGNIFAQMTAGEKRKFKFFEGIGVDFADNEGKMLTGTEILQNLANVYDDLSTEEKTTAKFYLAGKEHAETLSGILDSWDTVIKSAETVNDELGKGDTGSAYIEHAKQADSVKFKLQELKNAWDELLYSVGGGTGGVGKVLDMLSFGIQKVNDLLLDDEFMRMVKYIFAGVGVFAGANAFKRVFDTLTTGLGNTKNNISQAIVLTTSLIKYLRTLGNTDANVDINMRENKTGGINSSVNTTTGGSKTGNTKTTSKGNVVTTTSSSNVNKEKTKGKATLNKTSTVKANTSKANTKSPKAVYVGTLPSKKQVNDVTATATKSIKPLQTTVKLVGSLLNLLPYVGTALLLMDATGYDVWGKISNYFSDLIVNQKDVQKELEETQKTFLAKNFITNGSMNEWNNLLTGKGGIEDLVIKANVDGNIDQDEFIGIQAQFNELAELADIDAEITFNDYDHILEQIEVLKAGLREINKEEFADYNKGYEKQRSGNEKATKQKKEAEELIKHNEEKIQSYKRIIDDLEDTKIERGFLTTEELALYETAKEQIEERTEKIKELKDDVIEYDETIKVTAENMEELGQKLMEYSLDGGELMSMDLETSQDILSDLTTDRKKLLITYDKEKNILAKLKAGKDLEKEDVKYLSENYENLAGIKGDMSKNEKELVQEAIDSLSSNKDEVTKLIEEYDLAIKRVENYIKELQYAEGETSTLTSYTRKLVEQLEKTEGTRVSKIQVKVNKAKAFDDVLDLFGGKIKRTVDLHANVVTKVTKVEQLLPAQPNTPRKQTGHDYFNESVSAISSNSVSSNSQATGGDLVKSPTTVQSNAKSSKQTNNSKVDSDVWRYLNTELYKIGGQEKVLAKLEKAITNAGENQKKLISLYKQQISALKVQNNNQKTLLNSKNTEINSVLKQLKKYGFKVDYASDKVLNLGHAKNLKGEKAEKAEELLNTWKSLYEEMAGIKDTIANNTQTIKEINETIKEAKIAEELEKFTKTFTKIEKYLKKVDKNTNYYTSRVDAVDDNDWERKMYETTKAKNASVGYLNNLMNEFNKLSTTKVTNKENAEEIQAQLESIGDEILNQADLIKEYQESLNQIKIDRITNDLEDFNNALADNENRLQNIKENVSEGLLSGTDISDLQSYKTTNTNITGTRDNNYETLESQRINLEKRVNDAVEYYGKKNIEKHKNIANSTLKIYQSQYQQLTKMNKEYTKYNQLKSNSYEVTGVSDNIAKIDKNYKLANKLNKAIKDLNKSQKALNDEYDRNFDLAKTQDERDAVTEKYLKGNLDLQEQYYKTVIEANKLAIADLEKLLKDNAGVFTNEQEIEVAEQINALNNEIIESQNGIKDTIAERFEVEFEYMQKAIDMHDKYAENLQYALDIIDSIDSTNGQDRLLLLREIKDVEESRNKTIKDTVKELEKQLAQYEIGSYEWNIINAQLDEYKASLRESNQELIEMNKNILSQSFTNQIIKIQKKLFGGKTLEAFQTYQELWMDGLERELALEDMYKRIAELGTTAYDEKMALLDKQEKLSRYEMDYLNKEIEILELQDKLANLDKERTVQTLKKQADGSWDWEYVADATELNDIQSEIAEKQLELQSLIDDGKEEYVSKLEEILSKAENGEYENIDELQKAIEDLNEAFSSLLDDVPSIQDFYLEQILRAYAIYEDNVANAIGSNSVSSNSVSSISSKNVSSSSNGAYSKDVIEKINDALIDKITDYFKNNIYDSKFELPNINVPSNNSDRLSDNVTIILERLEFPSVTNADGLREAILSLPTIAMQKAKEK